MKIYILALGIFLSGCASFQEAGQSLNTARNSLNQAATAAPKVAELLKIVCTVPTPELVRPCEFAVPGFQDLKQGLNEAQQAISAVDGALP